MNERAKPVETAEPQQTSEEITEVTRWMLMGEIRSAKRLFPENSAAVLNPEGYRLEFGSGGNHDLTVYPAESKRVLYELHSKDPGTGVEFEVSEGVHPAHRVPLDEKGGTWFRELIAEGVRKKSGSWTG